MSRQRLAPDARWLQLLDAGVQLAAAGSYRDVTLSAVAKSAGCTPSLVCMYSGGADALRAAVVKRAVQVECLPVIAQALAHGDLRLSASDPLRARALAAVG